MPVKKKPKVKSVQEVVISEPKSQQCVLVGTYQKRPNQLGWIRKRRLYNYPLSAKEAMATNDGWNKVKELWLYSGSKDRRHIYEAQFVGIKPRKEFFAENPDYPKSKKPHGVYYAIFKIAKKCQPTFKDSGVIVRVSDFNRTPDVANAIKAYQAGDGLRSLLDLLPSELASLQRDRLCIYKMAKKYRLIDLFCGCGGMTRGFMDTERFQVVYANDNNKVALESYKANFDKNGLHSDSRSIIDLVENAPMDIPRADIVIGGPPCQGFSLLNKNRAGDVRREMWQYYMEVVRLSHAHTLVMENVPQLIDSDEFNQILNELARQRFRHVVAHVLNAANYGVPETRKRTILIASKRRLVDVPVPTHLDEGRIVYLQNQGVRVTKESWRCLNDCIGDLPPPVGTEIRVGEEAPLDLHFGRTPTAISLERYRAVPYGGNRFDLQRNRPDITPACWIRKTTGGTDLFGRLWWERPSVTIRTEFFKPEKGRYLHPDQDRPITHREAARIQTFPDTFIFKGNKTEIAKQIGNAVPVLLANAVAKEVVKSMDGRVTKKQKQMTRTAFNELLSETIKVMIDAR